MSNPNARNTDPATSRQAAEDIIKSRRANNIVERVALIVGAHPGLIVSEITELYNQQFFTDYTRDQMSKRVSDANRQGLIQINLDFRRKCPISKKSCYTCWPKYYQPEQMKQAA